MKKIVKYIQTPKGRREILAILTGALVLAGLAAEHLLGQTTLANVIFAAGALLAGSDIGLRAWRSLLNRYISIELLVATATAGALVIGEYWEAAAVTFLFILGAYLEARTIGRTRQVLGELLDLAPITATVLRSNLQVEVPPHQVQIGEVVLVKPGAKVPVDGEVIEGHSAVDESAITGEPLPKEKTTGSQVYAGTINQAGLLKLQATGVGADTTLARIIRRVEEAQEEKAPTQRFIEKFARWYTPFIIALSAVVLLFTRDIELSLTILVIGCPGALVISTPVSVVAGIGRAAKSGILIKGGEYLENSGKISAIALDKTGTLTQGKPRLTDVIALQLIPSLQPMLVAGNAVAPLPRGEINRWEPAQLDVVRWAAIAEAGSEHPLASAILAEVSSPVSYADEFETSIGKGVRATYQGRTILVGTREFLESLGVGIPQDLENQMSNLRTEGKTILLVALDSYLIGILGVSDPLRKTAPAMIQKLKDLGLKRVVMLTGDEQKTAQAVAGEAGISEFHARLMPEDKLNFIRQIQSEGHVIAMAGDGINDSPALAAADIGIAMGVGGTDVAIETADIALISDDLMKIPEAIQISKATLKNIRQNVAVALVTVAVLLLGVLVGRIHMAGGMLIHEASVLVVILNGIRLL
jgi:Cd2+/Zn2+-exporting ATPase